MTVRPIRKARSLLGLVALSAAVGSVAALADLSAAQDVGDGFTEPGPYGEEAVLPAAVPGANVRSKTSTCSLELGPTQLEVSLEGHTHEPFRPIIPGDASAQLKDSHQRAWLSLIRDLKPEAQIRLVCSSSADVRDDETFTSEFQSIAINTKATFECPEPKPYLISAACRTRRLAPTPPDAGTPDAGAADADVIDQTPTGDQPTEDVPIEGED